MFLRIKQAREILRSVTVEPIVFLIFIAFSSLAVSEHTLLYTTVCLQNFGHLDDVDCNNLVKDPMLEDKVQKIASTWTIFLSLSYVVPAVLAENFLGALSDLYGRKFNILLGFTGLTITIVPDLFLTAYPQTPLSILIISNLLAGFTGYAATVLLSCLAYLADTVQDEHSLTYRMTMLSICKSLGALSGAFLSGTLTNFVSLGMKIMISEAILVIGFFYTLWLLPNVPPTQAIGRCPPSTTVSAGQRARVHNANGSNQHSKTLNQVAMGLTNSQGVETSSQDPKMAGQDSRMLDKSNKEPKHRETGCTPGVKTKDKNVNSATHWLKRLFQFARSVLHMNQEVLRTLLRKRRYHKRAYLLLCMMTFFCYTMSELGLQHGPIMSLYVFRRPFNWSPAELGTYKGVQHTFALAGSIFGAVVLKKCQNAWFQTTTIMLLALASGCAFLLLTGLAQSSHTLYGASVFGSFSGLLVPAMKSFVARQVEPGEVGKALAANGIAADIAFVVTTLVFTTIYNATLTVFAGLVFVLGAVVVSVCFCCMVWMHIDSTKQKRREMCQRNCIVNVVRIVSPTDNDAKCFT